MQSMPLLQTTMANLREQFPLLGMALLHHKTIRGAPMSFLDRPFQIEQYADFPKIPGADICKAVQTGQSEMFTIFGLHDAGWLGRIFAYVLPTDRIRNRFVSTRINPLLAGVYAYRARLPGAEQIDLAATGDTGSLQKKRMGSGLLLFLGAKTDGDFVELTADTFVVDEYDISHQAGEHNLIRVTDRLKESPDPRHFRLGNPELPGGIEKLFDEGDARLFHWQCPRCNERQPIDWLTNVVDRNEAGAWVLRDKEAQLDPDAPVRVVCRRCGRPFHRDAAGAAWVARQPSRGRRSYRVTRFDVMSEPLRNLWDEWMDSLASATKIREWYRRNAGRLHLNASNQVTRAQLLSLSCLDAMDYVGGEEYKGRAITAGIDVGALLHITVSESVRAEAGHVERRVIWTGTCRTKDQLLDILQRYRVRTAVIDQFPETRMAEEVRDHSRTFGCSVWLCQFHKQPKTTNQRFGMATDYRARIVRVDRTQVFDIATELLHAGADVGRLIGEGKEVGKTLDGVRLYPSDAPDVLGWADQMEAPKRLMVADKIVWDEGGKEDHFRLADVYDTVAWEIDGQGAVVFELG